MNMHLSAVYVGTIGTLAVYRPRPRPAAQVAVALTHPTPNTHELPADTLH